MIELESKSSKDTLKLGENIGRAVSPGAVILLFGCLGSGKTVFAKGMAAGLSIEDVITSPTYTILQVYEGRLTLAHFDLYRLKDADDFINIGGPEYLYGNGVCAIEWPENLMDMMPKERLEIHFDIRSGADVRKIRLIPFGELHEKLLAEALT